MGSNVNNAKAPVSTHDHINALVRGVYQATWTDFYIWEQDHCRRSLHSLARFVPQGIPRPHEEISKPIASGSKLLSLSPPPVIDAAETFTFMEYDTEDGVPKTSTFAVESFNVLPELAPCSAYEICTPASRNINVGDDSEYMPFIPLMDDPKFSYDAHIAEYRYFEWQLPNRDPDCKLCLFQLLVNIPTSFEWRSSSCRQCTNCTATSSYLFRASMNLGFCRFQFAQILEGYCLRVDDGGASK
jgi:hypothetical protein